MNYQVIIFDGHGPIVTTGGRNEVEKFKKRFGLAYNHNYESSFFETLEEATVFANAKAAVQQGIEQLNSQHDTTSNGPQPVSSSSSRNKRGSNTELSDLPSDSANDESGR
jgi:hypothetical protein